MARTLLIGFDGTAWSADAVALAALLAPVLDAEPVLLHASPDADRDPSTDDGARQAREIADRATALEAATFGTVVPARVLLVADRSPAAALQAIAAREDTAAIIVGSSHRGRLGRVLPGGVAQRLLAGAPCPVTVAPAGFARRQPLGLGTIGVGYAPTPEGREALRIAATAARLNRGPLRVITVGSPPDAESERVLADARLSEPATVVSREGDPVAALLVEAEDLGLLVVGSRGYGPLGAVLLGSVATAVLSAAACPVMVTPRCATERPPA